MATHNDSSDWLPDLPRTEAALAAYDRVDQELYRLSHQGSIANLKDRVGQLHDLSDAIAAAYALDARDHPRLDSVDVFGPALWLRDMVARYGRRRREAAGILVHHVKLHGDWYSMEWADGTRLDGGPPEGTAEELLSIAATIERRESASLDRCAVQCNKSDVAIWSPWNNSGDCEYIAFETADALAKRIREVCGNGK